VADWLDDPYYKTSPAKNPNTRLVGIYSRPANPPPGHAVVFAAHPVGGKIQTQQGIRLPKAIELNYIELKIFYTDILLFVPAPIRIHPFTVYPHGAIQSSRKALLKKRSVLHYFDTTHCFYFVTSV
jgi:hypothetical protein